MVRDKSFKIKCADLIIEIFYKYDSTKNHCLKYLADGKCDLSICPDDKDYELVKSCLKDETEEEIELVVISYLLADALVEKKLCRHAWRSYKL